VTFASQRDEQIARADRIAAALQGPDLPGWVHQPPGEDSWAPRLVHTDGASVTVTCIGVRVYFRAVRPDRLSHYRWTPLEISVAADAKRSWVVGNFTRRLAGPLLPQHADAIAVLHRLDEADAARAATCARLRQAVPGRLLAAPWPGDVHDVRLHDPDDTARSGHLRVLDADTVDITLDGVSADTAERVLHALLATASTSTTPGSTPSAP
jgi:hypothetical protein